MEYDTYDSVHNVYFSTSMTAINMRHNDITGEERGNLDLREGTGSQTHAKGLPSFMHEIRESKDTLKGLH